MERKTLTEQERAASDVMLSVIVGIILLVASPAIGIFVYDKTSWPNATRIPIAVACVVLGIASAVAFLRHASKEREAFLERYPGSIPSEVFRQSFPAAPEPEESEVLKSVRQLVHAGGEEFAERAVETFQTSAGPVTVAWRDETVAISKLRAVFDTANRERLERDTSARHKELVRRIGDILRANPRADLKRFQDDLRIVVTQQDGPSARVDREATQFFDEEYQLGGMKAIAQVERFCEAHKDEFCGPGKPPKLCAEFLAMINRHKQRILEKM